MSAAAKHTPLSPAAEVIACADAWAITAGLPTYTELRDQHAELLEACIAYMADRAEAGCVADSAAVKRMRAAIAKATGEQP